MKLPTWHSSGDREKAWRNSMNGLGRRLMETMGWREGQTLGRNGDDDNGLVKCLQPDVEDSEKRVKGIGADKSIHSSNWWENAFNSAALTIGKGTKKGKKRKGKDVEKEEKKQASKRSKKSGETAGKSNRDGTDTSATADELRIVENLSKQSWGFTGGREGKMERIRRQELEFMSSHAKASESLGATGQEVEEGKKSKKSKKSKKKEPKMAVELEHCEVKSKEYAGQTWWGYKIFSFSGVLGSLERKSDPVSEKDQEKAFFKAKENASLGHAGIGSQFLDITLGDDFAGKKLTFGEDGDEAAPGKGSSKEKSSKKDKKRSKDDKKKKKKKKKKSK